MLKSEPVKLDESKQWSHSQWQAIELIPIERDANREIDYFCELHQIKLVDYYLDPYWDDIPWDKWDLEPREPDDVLISVHHTDVHGPIAKFARPIK